MKVWIVNPFDNLPAEGYRPMRYFLMSGAFVRAGHDVIYWTADFSHANKAPRRMADGAPTASAPAFDIRPVHEPPYSANVSFRRLWAHWRWARNWRAAAEKESPPDMIVVSTPPLWIGREVRRYAAKTDARVVVDIMDDWPGTFRRVAPALLLKPLERLARANIRAAAAVTAVADRYADLARSYGFAGTVRRFYHGISLPSAPQDDGRATPSLRLVYLGSLGRTYDLTTVIEAMSLIPGATLDVAGDGEQLERLKGISDPERVTFHGYLSDDALRDLLVRCDIGIVPMSPESCVGVPYKFADYSSAGLAIVSSLGGESGKLLARHNAGAYYRGGDPQSFAESVRSLAPRLAQVRAASRRMAEKEFDAARIYSDYVAFTGSLLNNTNRTDLK